MGLVALKPAEFSAQCASAALGLQLRTRFETANREDHDSITSCTTSTFANTPAGTANVFQPPFLRSTLGIRIICS